MKVDEELEAGDADDDVDDDDGTPPACDFAARTRVHT